MALLPEAEIREDAQLESPVCRDFTRCLQRIEYLPEPRHVERRLRIEHAVLFDVAEHPHGQSDFGAKLLGGQELE